MLILIDGQHIISVFKRLQKVSLRTNKEYTKNTQNTKKQSLIQFALNSVNLLNYSPGWISWRGFSAKYETTKYTIQQEVTSCCEREPSIKLTLCVGRILQEDIAYTVVHSLQNNSQQCKEPLDWNLICLGRQTQEDKVYRMQQRHH